MKRLIGVAAGLAMIAGLATAQTNVLSQNAVGYVKITVESPPTASALYLLSTQWLQIDGTTNTIAKVLGDQLPNLTQVFTWNGTGYNAPSTYFNGNFVPPGTGDTAINPADGFWIQIPPNTPSTDIFLLGEVPGANNGFDSNVVQNLGGIQLVSNPYPVNTTWTNIDLAVQLPNLSQLFVYDGGFGTPSTKLPTGAWNASPDIDVGEGFFVAVGAGGTGNLAEWVETKPYTWP